MKQILTENELTRINSYFYGSGRLWYEKDELEFFTKVLNKYKNWLNELSIKKSEQESMVEIYTYTDELLCERNFGAVKALLVSADLETLPTSMLLTLTTVNKWIAGDKVTWPESYTNKLRKALEKDDGLREDQEWLDKLFDGWHTFKKRLKNES